VVAPAACSATISRYARSGREASTDFVAILIARSLREAGEIVLPLLLFDPPSRPFELDPAQITEQALLEPAQDLAPDCRAED